MKCNIRSTISLTAIVLFISCSETNTEVNTNANNLDKNGAVQDNPNMSSHTFTPDITNNTYEAKSKTDAEVILQGLEFALEKTQDIVRRQKIKDSINDLYKDKYFAYQIGIKQGRDEAYDAYKKLSEEGVSSLYVFKVSRKEYYLVKFQAKLVDELTQNLDSVKVELGEYANEGIKIINLTSFCNRRESVMRTNKEDDDVEIRCLICD
jgi:hypothetical protein